MKSCSTSRGCPKEQTQKFLVRKLLLSKVEDCLAVGSSQEAEWLTFAGKFQLDEMNKESY